MRIIAKRAHTRDCFMVESTQHASPWCLDYDKPEMRADKHGNGTGSTNSWIRIRCNDPKCTALALIHHGDLMTLVQAGVRGTKAFR